ncbi:PD-(D/E)XK nuclease family protein [uncultured Flavobacterium sp.]|uniref:PD-(D/E)XK nuclease family protein n=1 Tax=uncultured Flavobacterium sp. TaxID=165435 RepID=UPI0030CA1737
MSNPTFLSKLTDELLLLYSDNLSDITIVLPSKRARVFLIENIQAKLSRPIFSPNIISIEEFIKDVSGLRSVDSMEILFEFYHVYTLLTKNTALQDFEEFSKWAKTLIHDFNEIDCYFIDPNHVFSYLKDVEALKRWDLELNQTTNLIDTTLAFWDKLPLYYATFYKHLLEKGIGYQGLLYRESVANLDTFSNSISSENKIIFAGFNALNQAEERIFKHLLLQEKALVYWDIDYSILQDSHHDAGLFIRKYKKEWNQFDKQSFKWIENHFEQEKNIQIIGTPKTVGQTKIVGNLIEEIQLTNINLQNTAVVLGDENLLLPVLYNLPESVESLNITMGYPSKNNPAQLLITKIFKLHTNAKKRNEKQYTLYYKEVLEILSHSLIEPYIDAKKVEEVIKTNNFTFFSNDKLFQLYEEYKTNDSNVLFELIFSKWNDNASDISNQLSKILLSIKEYLSHENQEDIIAKAFIHSIYLVLNRISTFIDTYQSITSLSSLFAIYKQVIDLAEVSFEGKPLSGLQVMGVLESRVLDFENVIITSVNEGKFPSGKSSNSFIPYDIKKELGLPTFREKDAIYSYHFYHLLHRAKNIYLLYNSDNSDGIDAGEKSRFITQLEIDFPQHITKNTIYNAHLPSMAYEPIKINKTAAVLDRLKVIATENGFSPSSLTNYIRNPIQFYTQRILRIRESEEVEENIAVNTLGTIIHETLRYLYEPYIDKFLSANNIDAMNKLVEYETIKQFKLIFKEGEIKKGKNLLAFEVAKQQIEQFLKQEQKDIEAGAVIKVLLLEKKLQGTISDKSLPFDIKISGAVDRIELRDNKIRIIDYKTGKVEARTLKVDNFVELTSEIKNEKIIQLLCYALMFENNAEYKNYPVEAGIISFKNMKAGFMPFGLGKGKNSIHEINQETIVNFKQSLLSLILEILNPEIPFEEKL